MGSVLESICLQKSSPLGEFMLPLLRKSLPWPLKLGIEEWRALLLFSTRKVQSWLGVAVDAGGGARTRG